jgi:hypothetical protein
MTPGRDLAAIIYDRLTTDECLNGLLDELGVSHGTDPAFCDEPTNSETARPVRREQQGWPSDFTKAVITFGRFQKAPAFDGRTPWVEDWFFVVSVFARELILGADGTALGAGDLWALDIHDHVVRIIGWSIPGRGGAVAPNAGIACDGSFVVANRVHVNDGLPLNWDNTHHFWQIQARFRWTVIGRGLVAPICEPCR